MTDGATLLQPRFRFKSSCVSEMLARAALVNLQKGPKHVNGEREGEGGERGLLKLSCLPRSLAVLRISRRACWSALHKPALPCLCVVFSLHVTRLWMRIQIRLL